ncbi:MAG: choice-of-anchor Q domain-containing protein [Pleurocapsa sp.]
MSNTSISNQNSENEADYINSNVITVTTLKDENNSESNGYGTSLREAIALAISNEGADLILFDSNLSGSTIELTQGELKIEDSVTIKNITGENITINAQNNSRAFNINDGDDNNAIDVTIESLNITEGRAVPDERGATGGGILNQENLTVSGVNISNNSADIGGGILNEGMLNVYNSIINNNGAGSGGAIANNGVANISQSYIYNNSFSAIANSGLINIIYTEIYDNLGVIGGAIDNSGEANLTYSKVYNNSASSRGGGIINREGKLIVTQSEISNNSAGEDGGGVYNSFGELGLSYSTVSGNTSDDSGAGIANYRAIANIDGSNITGNSIVFDAYGDPAGGGGISVISSSLNMTDSDVNNNEAIFGAGIYSDSATVNIDGSTIRENYSGFVGGGLYSTQTELNLTDSVITSNEASFAYGGIGIDESTGNITNSTISDNVAIDTGGISINNSTGNITNSTVSGNTATELDAGGIRVSGATANINNSTISDNSASNNGGGIYNGISSETNLSNSTVSGNSATDGGGIYQNETIVNYYANNSYSGSVNLNSTIVAGNVNDSDLGGEDNFNSNGNNLIGNADGFDESIGEANSDILGTKAVPLDPNLGELQDNGGATETQALLEGSQAIDSGNNNNDLSTDQRGENFERTGNNVTDIGAFEVQTDDVSGEEYPTGMNDVDDELITGSTQTIVDFQPGEEIIVLSDAIGFDDLDTNYSGILDDGDDWVSIIDNSTIIDLDSNIITVQGITNLTADDFAFETITE